MRQTGISFAHHVGRMIKYHWFIKGKVKVYPTKTEKKLKDYGYEVVNINDILYEKEKKGNEMNAKAEKNICNYKNFKSEPCFLYGNNDVLLQGLEEGMVLTNSVEIEGLPIEFKRSEDLIKLPDEIHKETKSRVILSCLLDATQAKLPKKKDPTRPAWNLPRDYGINDSRKNELLCKNLVSVCQPYVDMSDKCIVNDVFFSASLEAHNKKIQFEISSELVIASKNRLKKVTDSTNYCSKMKPNIYPVHCTVSLKPSNYYIMRDVYPFNVDSTYPYIQTAFCHLNPGQVKNVFEENLTETQIYSRSLLKGFSIGVAQARALFGKEVIELPDPVIVPVIQTNGQHFHFTLFQLNTLNLHEDSNIKNVFWNSPIISLYESCDYVLGRPILRKYNPEVIKKILTFLNLR